MYDYPIVNTGRSAILRRARKQVENDFHVRLVESVRVGCLWARAHNNAGDILGPNLVDTLRPGYRQESGNGIQIPRHKIRIWEEHLTRIGEVVQPLHAEWLSRCLSETE